MSVGRLLSLGINNVKSRVCVLVKKNGVQRKAGSESVAKGAPSHHRLVILSKAKKIGRRFPSLY